MRRYARPRVIDGSRAVARKRSLASARGSPQARAPRQRPLTGRFRGENDRQLLADLGKFVNVRFSEYARLLKQTGCSLRSSSVALSIWYPGLSASNVEQARLSNTAPVPENL